MVVLVVCDLPQIFALSITKRMQHRKRNIMRITVYPTYLFSLYGIDEYALIYSGQPNKIHVGMKIGIEWMK
jgi:hypothetical protein